MEMLTDKDARPASTRSRISSIPTPTASEMVAYADLVLPDTTYLERWDCISLLDRPIGDADGPADAIRQPVVEPDRDVRAFQTVLLDLGARLGLPRHDATRTASPKYPGRLSRLHRQPRARARRRPARRLARRRRRAHRARRASIRSSSKPMSPTSASGSHELQPDQKFFKFANQRYLEFAAEHGLRRPRRSDRHPAL